MKIVHSLWSKPALTTSKHVLGRNLGGWNSQKYHLFSWALSCLSIKNHYSRIELVTDTFGKELLIDKLGLPYTEVTTCLDSLNHYHNDLFAIGKLYAYSIQNEPFLHLDSDVYIWKRFNETIENSPLIAQNEEVDFQHDKNTLNEIYQVFEYIPKEILNFQESSNLYSSNAGVLGGTDVDFFKDYVAVAFEFINNNQKVFRQLTQPPLFNVIFEQYLFTCMARNRNIDIAYVFRNLENNYLRHLCSFENIPKISSYIHVIGPYKKSKFIEQALESRLLLEFPSYYYRIIELIEHQEI